MKYPNMSDLPSAHEESTMRGDLKTIARREKLMSLLDTHVTALGAAAVRLDGLLDEVVQTSIPFGMALPESYTAGAQRAIAAHGQLLSELQGLRTQVQTTYGV